jgi:hypothetical protein
LYLIDRPLGAGSDAQVFAISLHGGRRQAAIIHRDGRQIGTSCGELLECELVVAAVGVAKQVTTIIIGASGDSGLAGRSYVVGVP